jgi:hypothetical protein
VAAVASVAAGVSVLVVVDSVVAAGFFFLENKAFSFWRGESGRRLSVSEPYE